MPRIDPERLLADLEHLRSFGARGTGVVRQSLSEVDMASRHWLCERLREAGLEPLVDGVGNVIGRSPNPGKALLLGSHSDTQPTGGWLDGALGVIYGLEVARALGEDHATRGFTIDVAAWIDEEGTYIGMLGSRSFCGDITPDAIDAARARNGRPLREALGEAGVAGRPAARLDAARYAGYLEAHIEQGPWLEAEGKRIGVVTAIIGMRDFFIHFEGEQNHAGTTPMAMRKDAGAALIEFAHRVQCEFPALAGERTVWTIGSVTFEPGAPSIIPGRARMLLQFRDPDETLLDTLEDDIRRLIDEANAAGPVHVRMELRDNSAVATPMDSDLQAHIARAAERHAAGQWVRMPSGAAHDAQTLARCMPAAMLFVPSINGVSHSFAEDTRREDIVLGCQVLASAAATILQKQAQ